MNLVNKSDLDDKVIRNAWDWVVSHVLDYEMNEVNNEDYDPGGTTLKVWNRKETSKKDWQGWAYWGQNTIHLWVNPNYVASVQKKMTLFGNKRFVVYGIDGMLVTLIAHELAHTYFRESVHPITRSVEVAASKAYFKKHGPLLPAALWKAWRNHDK